MRDVCARFKYCEGSTSVMARKSSSLSSSSSSSSSDQDPSCSPSGVEEENQPKNANTSSVPRPEKPATDKAMTFFGPSRELIHECLRLYYAKMDTKTPSNAWQNLSEMIQADLQSYQMLKLGGFSLGNACAKVLGLVLRMNKNLQTLDLGFNRITNKGASYLAAALHENQTLESLYLSGNEIGPTGARALAEALKKNFHLKSLHLSGNNIGEEGAKAIAEGLKENSSLTSLYLATNGIGSNGMKCLAEALRVNRTLQELVLGQNRIGTDGLNHLTTVFASNQVALTTLEIGKNGIDAEGATTLARVLRSHPNRLQNLYFDSNSIGDAAASAFGALLMKNRMLRVLDLSYTQMSLLGLRELSIGLAYSDSLLCLSIDGHDWSSTKHMKKATGMLGGASLSTSGANQYAASCVLGAIVSNRHSALFKLTGVDLRLALQSMTLLSDRDRERLLVHAELDSERSSQAPMGVCDRNERVLLFVKENRYLFNNQKRKITDLQSPGRQAQRQKTTSDIAGSGTCPSRGSSAEFASASPSMTRRTLSSSSSVVRSNSIVSSFSGSGSAAVEANVRNVLKQIARIPPNQQELEELQELYLAPRQPASQAVHGTLNVEGDANAFPSTCLLATAFPRAMTLLSTSKLSLTKRLVFLRQLHYLRQIFASVEASSVALIERLLLSMYTEQGGALEAAHVNSTSDSSSDQRDEAD